MRTVNRKRVSQMGQYEPHPYALLMPPLSDEEYQGLKGDIQRNGIQLPVIVDEDEKILDGVHRNKIAAELGIDLPVSARVGLDDDGKLKLALGLNLYRRHMDSAQRRELVENLFMDGLSVRRIAAVTGWSKSTVGRDVQEIRTELLHQTALWLWCAQSEPEPSLWAQKTLDVLGLKTVPSALEAIRRELQEAIGAEVRPLQHACGYETGDECRYCNAMTDYLVLLNQSTKGGRAGFLKTLFSPGPHTSRPQPQCLDDVAELARSRELFTSHKEWRSWIISSGIADVLGDKIMDEFDAFHTRRLEAAEA